MYQRAPSSDFYQVFYNINLAFSQFSLLILRTKQRRNERQSIEIQDLQYTVLKGD